MINTKYNIYLIIAIFLALGLGMMIGITLENKNVIENQQASMIKQIEESILYYRAETENLKGNIKAMEIENQQLHSVTDKLVNEVTSNQLLDMSIGLVSFDDELENEHIAKLLEHSGAFIQSNIVLPIDNLSNVFNREVSIIESDNSELIALIIEDIAYSLCFGGTTSLIQEIHDLGIIESNPDIQAPVDNVIIVGGGKHTSLYDSLLIENLIDFGIHVIAVESNNIAESAMEDYISYGISTIDNIDTLFGRLSLVSVLIGNSGNYGVGIHSDALVPDTLFIIKEDEIIDYDQIID